MVAAILETYKDDERELLLIKCLSRHLIKQPIGTPATTLSQLDGFIIAGTDSEEVRQALD